MTSSMNKKQLSCLVAGLCCTTALIAFCIWAGIGGFFERFSHPAEKLNRSEKNVTEPVMSIKDRRGFIFSRSSDHPETVRIVASVATSKPVPIIHTNSSSPRVPLAKIQRSETMATLANEGSSQLFQRQQFSPTPKSFFDLPDSRIWGPALVQQSRSNSDAERSERFYQPMDGTIRNWDHDSFNMSKLLNTVSQIFGVDLEEEDPHVNANRDAVSADRSSWVTLSYLSLSIFLLRQMDRILKLQSEPSDPLLMEERGRSMISALEPWTYNSLNLLFTEPNNNTDIEGVINNVGDEDSADDYIWAAHNILRASKDLSGEGLDCIWSAYCTEIDNRASLDGVTGALARMNAVVLKMVTGWLSPSTAVIKLIRSPFNWNGIDCNKLFPRCKPEEAVNYLVRLATTTSSN
ncbi:Uncharacterized protein APZ42_017345 [Daphnia magna]|uniref:Uncharacterized protein n=1 Tax=Daphnia magna TaxID=35525 RepID=A0A164ZU23_9CRUS|nr:Uncharacterized protein APZ42_017345 [Daphnia magna]